MQSFTVCGHQSHQGRVPALWMKLISQRTCATFRSITTLNLSKQQSAGPALPSSRSLFPFVAWINQSNSPDRDAQGGLVGATEHFFQTTKTSLQTVSRKFELLPLLYPSTHSLTLSFGSSFNRTWIPIITSYSTPSKHTQSLPLNISRSSQ